MVATKKNLEYICDIELVMGLMCIMPMIEVVHIFIKFAHACWKKQILCFNSFKVLQIICLILGYVAFEFNHWNFLHWDRLTCGFGGLVLI